MICAFKQQGNIVEELIIGNNDYPFERINQTNKNFLKKFVHKYIWRSAKDYALIKRDKDSERLIEKTIRQFNPDVVYERASFLCSSGLNICKRFNIKYVVEVNAPFSQEMKWFEGANSFFGSVSDRILRSQLNYSNKVITVSSALKNYLKEYCNDDSKITVTPNSVNESTIQIDSLCQDQLKKKYEITQNTIVIGFVGSIFPYHGVDLLIKAFSEVKKIFYNHDIKLLIVGDGYMLEELKQLTKTNKTEDDVIFTGSVKHENIFTYIDLMDVTVMAKSNWYGSPVKIFEYGALGKAIIAPDVSPVRDVMEDGVDGLLVQPSVEKISEALNKFLGDPDLRKKLGNNFKSKVLSNYTWYQTAETILTTFNI